MGDDSTGVQLSAHLIQGSSHRRQEYAVLLWAILSLVSCKKDEPIQPHVPSIQLSVEDVSCTEAWLKVSLTDASEPRTVGIQQDGQRVLTARIIGLDSLLVVDGLLPRHTYAFVAQRLRDSIAVESTLAAQATTMDTTDHNLTWQIDTLGVGNSSVLYDVVIINDTLAYAVGEMYLRDSTGQLDQTPYNLAKWNGARWENMRIEFYTICGQQSETPYPASSVFAFGPTDVWIAMDGSQVARWNGNSQVTTMCLPWSFSIRKLWGSSPNSVYAVGDAGNIAYYNGSTWQRVESGTTIPLNDVWGGSNRIAGEDIVLVTGGDRFTFGEKKLLRLRQNGEVDSLVWGTIYRRAQSVWFDQHVVLVGGDGLFRLTDIGAWEEMPVPNIFLDRVRGTGRNDVYIAGDFGLLLHYNGVSMREYPEVSMSQGIYKSVAATTNLVVAVGWVGLRAVALVGRR